MLGKLIMSAAILLHNRNNLIFYHISVFIHLFIVVLFTIDSGKTAAIQEKLIMCIQQPSLNIRETMLHFDKCAGIEFKHCYQDDVTGLNSDAMSLLRDSCGFIDSRKVSLYRYTWWITSQQTVWIDMLNFNIYFIHFPCTVEYMTIKDTDKENLYCDSRVPWRYYSISSTINVTFISDILLLNKGEFQLFFQEGKQFWQTTHIFQAALIDLKHTLFFHATRDQTQLLYFITHRLHKIHLNITSCWSSSHAAIYDGPGIHSPQKKGRHKCNILSFHNAAGCNY